MQTGAQCAGGVNITIPVQEGVSYRWAKSIWDGSDKLTVEELATALGMNPGDLADGTKIDNGLKSVDKAYGRRGFLTATIQSSAEYDDAASLDLASSILLSRSGLTRLVDELHRAGSKVSIQLGHGGGHTRVDICGEQPVAPSAIPHPVYETTFETIVPEEMTKARIDATIAAHATAAAHKTPRPASTRASCGTTGSGSLSSGRGGAF